MNKNKSGHLTSHKSVWSMEMIKFNIYMVLQVCFFFSLPHLLHVLEGSTPVQVPPETYFLTILRLPVKSTLKQTKLQIINKKILNFSTKLKDKIIDCMNDRLYNK